MIPPSGLKTAPCAGHEAAAPQCTGHARAAAAKADLVQFALHAPPAVAHLAFEMSGSNLGIEACSSGVTVALASRPPPLVPRPPHAAQMDHRYNCGLGLLRQYEAVAPRFRSSRAKNAAVLLAVSISSSRQFFLRSAAI